MNTTSHLFESFLDCPTKCFLRAHAEVGSTNQYATWLNSYKSTYRNHSLQRLQKQLPEGACLINPPSENELNSNTWLLAVNAPACTQNLVTQIQAIERVPSVDPSKPAQLIPIRFVCFNKLSKDDRLLLTFDAFVLSKATGRDVTVGKIIHGDDYTTLKSNISNLLGETCKLIGKTTALVSGESPPDLILNRHCSKCEFQATCRRKALEKDDLSLLAGMTEKERRKHRMRGIFTVTQLSYTFRPRRTPKRVTSPTTLHYFSLQALALQENKVYVHGNNVLPQAKTHVYLDIEGLPDRDSYYLIGALITSDGQERFIGFWADNESDEVNIFSHFVESVSALNDFRVYHYGDYEIVALKRLIPRLPQHLQEVASTILGNSVNVASFLYSHIYFPVYSNGLKQVATYLGYTWSIPESSGLQSIAWRMQWEESHEHTLKHSIVSYNHDDCTALKLLVYFISNLPRHDDLTGAPSLDEPVGFTENIAQREDRRAYGTKSISPIEGYEDIIHYAYFDYQRTKVYVRTYPRLKGINTGRARTIMVPAFRPNVRIELRAHQCPYCGGRNLVRDMTNYHAKKMLDVRISTGGIRRWVTEYRTPYHKCLDCEKCFTPRSYKHKRPFGHTLMVWAMLQHVCNRTTYEHIAATARECFGVQITHQDIHRFKAALARHYRGAYHMIMAKLVRGNLIHADETKVLLKKASGYVWVFASMEEVVYMYRPNRKADFLHTLLKSFKGVLVSDFYTGYDSLKCAQQKCLIHVIRDVNDDLLKHPFDGELADVSKSFGSLLRNIVATIDKRGLKRYWLHAHQNDVQKYFDELSGKQLASDIAGALRKRLLRYNRKLFTFLDYDGVPWNNNKAEHVIKYFAKYRRLVNGRVTDNGIIDYLVLLSIYQTCEYHGLSFLKFMLSGMRDIDKYQTGVSSHF